MATAQMHRSTASAVMIPNIVATEYQSLVLVKRLLAISVSCITYLRGLFPENAYGTRYLEDLCVKILREDESCPGSTQMVKWMLGCYDALQKKYLRMAVLAIYTNIEDAETVTEYYQFKFKYSPSGPIMEFSSNEGHSFTASMDVKKASIMLVRKLYILMQNLGPLPNDVCLTMKLFYYDEVTPNEYQPPGFKEGTCDSMMFEGDPMNLNVGEVATPFHVLKVRVTTDRDRMEKMEKNLLKKKSPTKAVSLNMEEDQVMESSTETLQASTSAVTSGCKTRSGRVIANTNPAPVTGKTQPRASKRPKKQQPNTQVRAIINKRKVQKQSIVSLLERIMCWESQLLDLSDSQDESTMAKRRKISEPKDPL